VPHRPAQVILCGPFPEGGKIGGYARCNELIATSFLDDIFGIERLPLTVPGPHSLLRRMATDVAHAAACLRRHPAPVFHLTAQYLRGTPREWTLFQMAKAAGKKVVYDIRAGNFVQHYEDPRTPLYRWMLASMLRRADAITVEGLPYARWLRDRWAREAVWVPNFVRATDCAQIAPAPLTRPSAGEPCEVVYVGRFVRGKGIEETLQACQQLLAEGLAVRVHLVGGGDAADEARLRHQAAQLPEGAVVFHGTLDHRGVLELLRRCHIFSFASSWPGEGHANAINEAMQAGLAIVTTRQGFLGDVVTPACGMVLDEASTSAVAAALRTLLADWPRLQAAGAAARARVIERYVDEVVLRDLGNVYAKLLGRSDAYAATPRLAPAAETPPVMPRVLPPS
jgi:glycosyltransferase involved in cell wall biosynthesis